MKIVQENFLDYKRIKGASDSSYEVPKLFRFGLGLVLRGRP